MEETKITPGRICLYLSPRGPRVAIVTARNEDGTLACVVFPSHRSDPMMDFIPEAPQAADPVNPALGEITLVYVPLKLATDSPTPQTQTPAPVAAVPAVPPAPHRFRVRGFAVVRINTYIAAESGEACRKLISERPISDLVSGADRPILDFETLTIEDLG